MPGAPGNSLSRSSSQPKPSTFQPMRRDPGRESASARLRLRYRQLCLTGMGTTSSSCSGQHRTSHRSHPTTGKVNQAAPRGRSGAVPRSFPRIPHKGGKLTRSHSSNGSQLNYSVGAETPRFSSDLASCVHFSFYFFNAQLSKI